MENSTWVVVITSLIAGASGIGAVITAINSKKKSKADALKTIEEATTALIEHYRRDNEEIRGDYNDLKDSMESCINEIQGLKIKVADFEQKHGKLLIAIERLVHQVHSLGHKPVCGPEILE